jgi:23S rRNA (uracil1939-C5)-methyltransferase
MKKHAIETVHLDKIVPGGQALGALPDGRKVFVWGALPGETARVELIKVKKSYAEGVAVEILESSPQRIAPRDDCFLATSPWQIFDYDYELAMKAELVREAFKQEGIGRDEAVFFPEDLTPSDTKMYIPDATDRFVASDGSAGSPAYDIFETDGSSGKNIARHRPVKTDNRDYFYRNKMEYALYWDNDENLIKLAFHKRGSHQKIPIDKSSIERPEIFAAAHKIVAELNAKGEPARKYQSLLVRCNQNGEVSSALFENGQPHPRMKNLTDDIMGHEYSYSPNGFFQINLPVYEMALAEIKKHIRTDKVVDMYAGVGTIGLSVARDRELALVETDDNAFRELERNATGEVFRETLSRATFSDGERVREDTRNDGLSERREIDVSERLVKAVHAKSENALQYITHDITLIVDPPRAGLDEKVITRILDAEPPRVVYLSCNPTTQARDIAKLLNKYRITHAQTFNFFPRTPHIENLVVLNRK